MTPRDLLRRRFGLSDEEPFELLGVVELPAGDVEHGLSGQTPGAPAVDELLADQLFDAPDLVSVDPGIDRLELSLSAWETDPRVLVLESPGVPLHIAGQVELLRGTDWAVDSRGPGGALAVLDGDRVVAVVGEGGSFRIERIPVDPPDDPLLERLRRFEPSDVGPVEVPAPERWTAGLDPPTWLMTVARGLHSRGGSLGRLASAGLVARHNGLCYPSAKVALQARMSGDKAPIHRVLDWAKGLGPDALADLSERAAEAIDALAEALVMHRAVAVRDPDAAARSAWRLRLERDELESVVSVLSVSSSAEALRRSLDNVDEEAAARASELLWPAPEGHAHAAVLAAARRSDPGSWWATKA